MKMVMMMMVMLLLGACVDLGLSDIFLHFERMYGSNSSLKIHHRTRLLEFIPKHKAKGKVLWMPGYASGTQDRRWRGVDRKGPWQYYELRYLTQEDSGIYHMKDKDDSLLSTTNIEVIENIMSFERTPGESLNFTFDLEPNFCNIYFFVYPGSDLKRKQSQIEVVHRGVLQDTSLEYSPCVGIQLLKPCGIWIRSLQQSCEGSFVVKDQNGNKALTVSLEMMSSVPPIQDMPISALFFLFLISTCCCACVKTFCCGSDAKENNTENGAAAAEPEVPAQPSETSPSRPFHPPTYQPQVPAQPSGTSSPRSFHPPTYQLEQNTDTLLPTYSEVCEAGASSSPTILSNTEPRFEIKGITFASDTSDVYNSDKLNFL